MKIGIMSMQRIANYGSFLQAYALKKILGSLGHEVTFVDYRPGESVYSDPDMKRTPITSELKLRMKCMLKKMLGKEIYFYERYQLILRKLGITSKMNYDTAVDTLVIGSDEVFNCLQTNPDVGFSTDLFGKDAKADKVITYAASFGHTTEDGLYKAGKYDEVKGYITNLDSVSVRDENSMELVLGMGVKDAVMHLDPVLVYGYKTEAVCKKTLSDYVLVYSYAGRIKDEKEIDAIRSFAKKHGKKTVSIGFHQPWTDIKLEADPFELLGYFKDADFVVTDTFHGTIFSIINKKKFITLVRESNKQKLTSLLDTLGLTSRIASDISRLEETITTDVDYDTTEKILENERSRSIEYLKNNL